jgi:tRNA pseudouridine38-40 synthase
LNYRITLAYDGTDYYGWQVQPDEPTIQGVVSAALEKFEGSAVVTYAAGRTDAGVHAEGQVVSFRLAGQWSGNDLLRAINGNIPQDIRVLEASAVEDTFHAQNDAKRKTYRYQLYCAEVMHPFLARYAWHYPHAIDLGRLREDSSMLVGTHDFSAFTVSRCEVKTRVRTVTEVRVEQQGFLVSIYFTGDGFLRYQVRTMVGALLDANRGRLKARSIEELIASCDRSLTGTPAPARGLTLVKVEY